MPEFFQGTQHEPNFEDINRTEEVLIELLNDTYARFSRGDASEAEYRAALRKLNDFAARKPLPRQRLMGLD